MFELNKHKINPGNFKVALCSLFVASFLMFVHQPAEAQNNQINSQLGQPTTLPGSLQPIAPQGTDITTSAQPAVPSVAPVPVPEAPTLAPQLSPEGMTNTIDQMTSPGGFSATLKVMLLLTVISLAPSILMMTTSFIRFVIVFGLLRQALGTQQLPPNQVIIALCMFLTFLVMSPVWNQSYQQGIVPYTNPAPGNAPISFEEAYQRAAQPVRDFMTTQIEAGENGDTVLQLWEYQNPTSENSPAPPRPETYDDIPISVLLPSYMLSELKTAFIIGFQVYLPFVVIDMVIATILISMGMMMLPPVLISLPFKLLLFVLIDGWSLTVGMLLEGVQMVM